MNSKFIEEMNQDYQDFMTYAENRPSSATRDSIFKSVYHDLNPNPWLVFSKIALIHFLIGLVTLIFCPQFGVRILVEGMGLMHFFDALGVYGCRMACGAFFVGTSLLVSAFSLNTDELRVLKKQRFLQIAAITFLSLGAFIMLDAEVVIGFAAAWIFGSIMGGLVMLEVGTQLKKTHYFTPKF